MRYIFIVIVFFTCISVSAQKFSKEFIKEDGTLMSTFPISFENKNLEYQKKNYKKTDELYGSTLVFFKKIILQLPEDFFDTINNRNLNYYFRKNSIQLPREIY